MSIASLFGPVQIAANSIIGEHCILGYPKEQRLRAEQARTGSAPSGKQVVVGERCLLFNHLVVYEGVRIGDDCVIEDRVRIGYDSRVGPRSRLLYGAYLCDRVVVGADTGGAGFVCDGTIIGDRSTVMGELAGHLSLSPGSCRATTRGIGSECVPVGVVDQGGK